MADHKCCITHAVALGRIESLIIENGAGAEAALSLFRYGYLGGSTSAQA